MTSSSQEEAGSDNVYRELWNKHGPLMGSTDLRKALGFPTQESFRQAVVRNKVGIHVFSIPGRRGKFARTSDVATWLASLGPQH